MLLLRIPKKISLLYKGFMLPICSHVINSGSVVIIHPPLLLTSFNYVTMKISLSYSLSTQTTLYIQEQGSTINYLVVQQHYQNIQHHHSNIQMRNHSLMLNQILAYIGVNVPIHIPDVPVIPSLTNIFKTSAS